MARKWTDEEKQKQRDAIRRWKPWEKSTGPKTDAGKKQSRENALKHGSRAAHMAALRLGLKANRDFLAYIHEWALADNAMARKLDLKANYNKPVQDQQDNP